MKHAFWRVFGRSNSISATFIAQQFAPAVLPSTAPSLVSGAHKYGHSTMQIYEQWESGRPYPHPASLSFWEHERDQWFTHVEEHVLPPRLADKISHDLHLKIEAQRQRKRYQPYLHNGKPLSNPATINLQRTGSLLNLGEPLQKLLRLAWCVGREESIPEDRTLACAVAACRWSEPSERIELLAALLEVDEPTCKQLLAPPFMLLAAGILEPAIWNTGTSLLALCTATDHFVDVIDGTYDHGRLRNELDGAEFDVLESFDDAEIANREIENAFGLHPIADVYREGAGYRTISAASIVTLLHWLTGLKLWTSDVRLLDKELGIGDVRSRVQTAAINAMTQQQSFDELAVLRALYAPPAATSA
jgi:hypothetical protein